ncbi:MAG: dimethyl sulfoxide reductase anchor subunit [Anaerolineae bacterium]|jgi:anaerobic dimethyl sulfoxide reductase subunit C (anchor subunit)|nr:dimethyl sulfoxide reductase anchor subunit [Anaerolineae bacterium]MBT3712970.1 dimethyl sulfoxide reductase anchor subunit [Anaerolineae bacterium]MBT4309742.1 dimethyl sulfoxide reductase anchor subunit [Anaerolineae bacterium]MBT4457963.1 dimethyl sulfoxide reductase anchor subunit [Anaerolineae bacterium]MBT4841361.1 dimethyl sulfoxide reductase anchor subunit [Anaerolineae bacterium]
MKKWSLVLFTTFSQMAVGAFWVLMALRHYLALQSDLAHANALILTPLMITVAIMIFSLSISLAHLGSPFIAYRAISNFRASWLSREIAFALFFTLSSLAVAFFLWAQIDSVKMQAALIWLAIFFGYMLVFSMSRVYMLRTVPIWNAFFTPTSFFLTALILGSVVAGTIFAFRGFSLSASIHNDILTILTKWTLLFLGIESILIIGRTINYASASHKDTIQKLWEGYKNIFYLRIFLNIAGIVCLSTTLSQAKTHPVFYALCFVLILSAELADRFLFYTAREFSGI